MITRVLHIDKGHTNRPGTKITVTGVVVHWTANEKKGANAAANRNYFNRKFLRKESDVFEADGKKKFVHASAHLIVDDKELIESLPWRKGEAEMGYHVGAKSYMKGILDKLGGTYPNSRTIGLEICVNQDSDFKKTYANAIKITAMMLKEHGLGVDKLFRHYDVTGKDCPKFHVDATYSQKYLGTEDYNGAWEAFKKAVQEELTSGEAVAYTPFKDKADPSVLHERVRMLGNSLVIMNPTRENYSIKGTDVRLLKLKKNTYTMKLVWAKGKKVSQLVKEYGADYGFNFPFFYSGNPIGDCKIGNKTLSVGYNKPDGAQVAEWHGFMYKDGQPHIGKFDIKTNLGADGFLVKSTPLLLNGRGQEVWDYYRNLDKTSPDIGRDKNGNLVRAQRTFIGLDEEGNFLLGIADGRTSSDQGLTLQEMAKYMLAHGAVWALNGDGGGSTILVSKKGGSLNQSLNRGVNERVVNHAVLVFLNKEEEKPEPKEEEVKPTEPKTKTTPEYWRVFMDNKQQGAYSSGDNALNAAKELYTKTKNETIRVTNPDGSPYYTPAKHPYHFPELILEDMDEQTLKAIYEYLKNKFK